MSDLVDKVVLAIMSGNRLSARAQAALAIRQVLAALREPNPAYDVAARENNADLSTGDEIMGAMLDAFAREHGLETGKDED